MIGLLSTFPQPTTALTEISTGSDTTSPPVNKSKSTSQLSSLQYRDANRSRVRHNIALAQLVVQLLGGLHRRQVFPGVERIDGVVSSTTDELRAEAFKNVVPHVETLERALMECSRGEAFFGGDAIGLADVALGSFLVWIQVVDEVSGTKLLDEAKFPGLAAWAERFLAVDAVKEATPEFERLSEHYKGFLAKLASPAAPAGYS